MKRFMAFASRAAALTACAAHSGGCASGEGQPPVVQDDRALIGSFPSGDPGTDAVGSIAVLKGEYGEPDADLVVVCTGSLIGPAVVVTAKHCLRAANDFGGGHRLVYLQGADGTAPARVVDVLATEGAPHDHGGYTGNGADVGVLHLAEPIEGVEPLRLAGIETGMIGKNFITLGYGESDALHTYGQRRVGTLTLRATSGPTYEALLGSFEAFYEFETMQPLPAGCDAINQDRRTVEDIIRGRSTGCESVALLRGIFDAYQLQQNHEIALGGLPGDTQPCGGDSGGPLLTRGPDGLLTAHGVVSGGMVSRDFSCDFGAVYASFSPEVLAFLQGAQQWKDPCSSLPEAGVCDGATARRCTTVAEGARRALSFDCAQIGSTCQAQTDGTVGCGADPVADIARPPTAAPTLPSASKPDPMKFMRSVFLAPGARSASAAKR